MQFGIAATKRGKVSEGVAIILKALLLRTNHPASREALTRALQEYVH